MWRSVVHEHIRHQWHSQNAEKVTHLNRETTGSSSDSLQLHQLFKMGTSLKGKNLLPEGANSFLFAPRGSKFFPFRAVPHGMENHIYHIR